MQRTERAAGPAADLRLSDEEVVARVCAGEAALYEVLMRRYNQRLYRAVRAILRNESEVEDVLQDAWIAAYRGLRGFDGRSRFSTWVVRIAVNRAIDRLRRRSRLVALDGWPEDALPRDASLDPGAGDPERESADRELGRLLARAVDALPVRYRSVYVLRELEGLSTRETAECLGFEPATVKTQLHRARVRLREALEREAGASAAATFRFGGPRCDRLVAGVFARLGALGPPAS